MKRKVEYRIVVGCCSVEKQLVGQSAGASLFIDAPPCLLA